MAGITTFVSNLTSNDEFRQMLKKHDYKVTKVSWEDCARSKGSCYGPNISDMTLAVVDKKGGKHLMPIIRTSDNFTDDTYDVPIGSFNLNVDGEIVPLKTYLQQLGLYLERDEHVLVSTQACILPVGGNTTDETTGDTSGKAFVNMYPQMFNYQSVNPVHDDPAVVTILSTSIGTSVQVLGNNNEPLYHNFNGTACYFRADRLQDIREVRTGVAKKKIAGYKEMSSDEMNETSMLVIQVPLERQKPVSRIMLYSSGVPKSNTTSTWDMCDDDDDMCLELSSWHYTSTPVYRSSGNPEWDTDPVSNPLGGNTRVRGADRAVLSIGESVGDYVGRKGLTLTRDRKFPVRVTKQVYIVTDSIPEQSVIDDLHEQLSNIKNVAIARGSLVTDTVYDLPNISNLTMSPPVGLDPALLNDWIRENSTPRVTEPVLSQPVAAENYSQKSNSALREYFTESIKKAAPSVWKGSSMSKF